MNVRHQMRKYANKIIPNLLSEARVNLEKLQDESSEAGPLTAKAWFILNKRLWKKYKKESSEAKRRREGQLNSNGLQQGKHIIQL